MKKSSPKWTLLVADDEYNIRVPCAEILTEEGYRVLQAETGTEVWRTLQEESIDLLLLDLRLPGLDGMDILRRVSELSNKKPDVIVITGQGTFREAVEATKLGAYDFLEKPLQPDRLLIAVQNCLKQRQLVLENIKLKHLLEEYPELIGTSPKIKALKETLAKIAPTHCGVLIHGETGTGKELVAYQIHRLSRRAEKAFVPVNCSAIPHELIESELFGHVKGAFTGAHRDKKGKFEQAHGGTIFLDEIGDMDLFAQAKVLRVLENGEISRVGSVEKMRVDVRVIAATNKNLPEEIQQGRFRADLFHRLNVVSIEVPPLRERKEDIPILSEYFLNCFSAKNDQPRKRLSSSALHRLFDYPWPGNVRELKNLMERLVVLSSSEVIEEWELEMLWQKLPFSPPRLDSGKSFREAKADFERELILYTLKKHNGNVQKAAEELKLNRSYLYEKMKELNILFK